MRVIAFVMAAGLLLTGCGSAEPKEPKPTAATSAAPTVPTMPPEAREDSKAGAIAFVKHYIELLNYASDTGDTSALKSVSSPNCKGCNAYIDIYESTYADGGYFRDPGWSVVSTSALTRSGELLVLARVDAPGGRFKATKASKEKESTSEKYNLVFAPKKLDSSWQLLRFSREAS